MVEERTGVSVDPISFMYKLAKEFKFGDQFYFRLMDPDYVGDRRTYFTFYTNIKRQLRKTRHILTVDIHFHPDKISDKQYEKLEDFLLRACEAEAKGGFVEVNRLFRLALYCEGRLRPDVTDAREYANRTGPVYEEARLWVPPTGVADPYGRHSRE